jgi:hypothetical protein
MLFVSVPFFLAFLLALTFEEPATVDKKQSQRYLATLMGGVKYFRQHRILRILAFDRISIETLAFLMIWIYQPLLKELHVPLVYFGLVHAGLTGVQIPFMNQFARLERAFGSKKKYLLWSALIAGGAFVLLGIIPYSLVAVFLLLAIAGFGLSRGVLFQNYMNKHIESSLRATVISTVSMIRTLVMGLLYPLVGLLVEWSLSGTLIIIGAAIVLCALLSKTREEYLLD